MGEESKRLGFVLIEEVKIALYRLGIIAGRGEPERTIMTCRDCGSVSADGSVHSAGCVALPAWAALSDYLATAEAWGAEDQRARQLVWGVTDQLVRFIYPPVEGADKPRCRECGMPVYAYHAQRCSLKEVDRAMWAYRAIAREERRGASNGS